MYNEKAIKAGLHKISDIINDKSHKILSYNDVTEKFTKTITWYEYQCMVDAIPEHWKFFLKTDGLIDVNIPKHFVLTEKKTAGKIYNMLISNENLIGKYWSRWTKKEECNFDLELTVYKKCFGNIYLFTNVVKLRNFQYRLLLDKIFCNKILTQWGIIKDPLCSFCKKEEETIQHTLFDCKQVQNIWEEVKLWCESKKVDFTYDKRAIIFNVADWPIALHSIVILVKQHIYTLRCKQQKVKV